MQNSRPDTLLHRLRRLFPAVDWPVTICVLLYGDHPYLAARFFHHLLKHTPPELFTLRIGLNGVCDETRALAVHCARQISGSQIFESTANLFKCPMMRRMFHEPPIETRWTIWFDDDSYVTRGDWLSGLALHIQQHPKTAAFGKPLFITPGAKTRRFVQEARWYRGLPWLLHPGDDRPIFEFVAGGFWAVQTSVLKALDWPDPRLIHFNNDSAFGEALRQNRYETREYYGGVAINQSPRRGPSNTPH